MWSYLAHWAAIILVCLACGAAGWFAAAEFAAWQNTKALLPQIIQLLQAHEAVLKTQAAKPAP